MPGKKTITFVMPKELASRMGPQLKGRSGFTVNTLPNGSMRVIVDRSEILDSALEELAQILQRVGITLRYWRGVVSCMAATSLCSASFFPRDAQRAVR